MDTTQSLIAALGVILAAAVTGYFAFRGGDKTANNSREDSLLTQLREVCEDNALRIGVLEVESRIKDDYIATLRRWINDGNAPPPPAWPPELTHR
jgi:hypothetical protein